MADSSVRSSTTHGSAAGDLQTAAGKPYYSKRPHKKSRTGCRNCKTRKVKCDEVRPTCKHCQLRKEICIYPTPPASKAASPSPPASPESESRSVDDRAGEVSGGHGKQVQVYLQPGDLGQYSLSDHGKVLLGQPFYLPEDTDNIDMRLLWLYATSTYGSFSTNPGKLRVVDDILKVKIVQYGFQTRFLMDALLALSALHLKQLTISGNAPVSVPLTKTLAYRARAFEGYRKAVEAARPEEFPAILAGSLILCALTSETLRDENAKPLYIIDWMIVWRGIGLIIDMITPQAMHNTGLAPLFSRPPINMDEAALRIPSNLLFMVTSIKHDDPDYPYVQDYYDTLKLLGALYQELEEGLSAVLSLRIIVWFTFLPKPFVELARLLRPRTLVIIAHYLTFAKLVRKVWWMEGISNRELRNISHFLGSEWEPLLRVPVKSIELSDKTEVAKLLMDNHAWEPPNSQGRELDLFGLVDDSGGEAAFTFAYRHPSKPIPEHRRSRLVPLVLPRQELEELTSEDEIPVLEITPSP